MYARLNDNYILRGWEGLPFALISRANGQKAFLTAETFALFDYLDGSFDLDIIFLSSEQQKAFDELRKQNAVQISSQPFPPGQPFPMEGYKKYPCHCVTGILWSITGGCNLRCRHCYISAPHYKYHDLDTAACLSLIDQMAAAGVLSVSLTGGEPLTRADFWVIVDGLRERGIALQSIFTNALLADDAFLDEYEKRGLTTSFLVSFDGLGRHDWLRGMSGCEERTVAALRRLLARKKRVIINTSLHTGNIDALLPTYEFLVELGVGAWRPGTMTQCGEWLDASCGEAAPKTLPREVLWERYLELARRYITDGKPIGLQLGPCFRSRAGAQSKPAIPAVRGGNEAELDCYACGSCRLNPGLMPDGRLLPCAGMTGQPLEWDMPNLLETPLTEVYSHLEHPFFALANLKVKDILAANERCRGCAHRLECSGGCRLVSILDGSGIRGRDVETCAFFKDGWRQKWQTLIEQSSL